MLVPAYGVAVLCGLKRVPWPLDPLLTCDPGLEEWFLEEGLELLEGGRGSNPPMGGAACMSVIF